MTDARLVVVGVDGSDCSRGALRFAADEAQMRGARLRIVCAWSVPAMAYAGFAPSIDRAIFRQAAASVATDAANEAHEMAPDLEIDAMMPEGQPAAALLSAAEKADLLIVGSRGHGGFARLLLGSVSQQLAHHAPCPITIIHSTASDGG
jgi:nucleotide-binding universal stress UspA family protein